LQFDVTFPALPCSLVAVDTMDVSGEQHYDIVCALQFPLLFFVLHLLNCFSSFSVFPDELNMRFAETRHNKEKN
jgi:hypothetical protein